MKEACLEVSRDVSLVLAPQENSGNVMLSRSLLRRSNTSLYCVSGLQSLPAWDSDHTDR